MQFKGTQGGVVVLFILHTCPQKYADLRGNRVGKEEAAPGIRKPQVDDANSLGGLTDSPSACIDLIFVREVNGSILPCMFKSRLGDGMGDPLTHRKTLAKT